MRDRFEEVLRGLSNDDLEALSTRLIRKGFGAPYHALRCRLEETRELYDSALEALDQRQNLVDEFASERLDLDDKSKTLGSSVFVLSARVSELQAELEVEDEIPPVRKSDLLRAPYVARLKKKRKRKRGHEDQA